MALEEMNIWSAQTCTIVWMLSSLPDNTRQSYYESGWLLLELATAHDIL